MAVYGRTGGFYRARRLVGIFMRYFLLIAGCIIFIYPFLWLISTSLKTPQQAFEFPPTLIPRPFHWQNYPDMFNYLPFFLFMRNTVMVTFAGVVATIFSSSLVAYGFSRLRWPGRDLVFLFVLSTMMLPPQVTMIPVYMIMRYIGWIDSLYPLWVPRVFGVPFFIFLLRQFFLTIPFELEDAARIDGCSYWKTYSQVILPLAKPALIVVTIFSFMQLWNDFLGPLIYINSVDKMTLALGLRLFQNYYSGEWTLMMAASSLMTIPVVILFFFTQRYFIQGITLTGMKG